MTTRRFPLWLVALTALLITFGACYLWRGVLDFFESGGNIVAPAVNDLSPTPNEPTEAPPPINLVFVTPTAMPPCQEFTVTVVRALVRECPSLDCRVLERPYEDAEICVFGVVPEAPEWYEVNLDPGEPLPRLGYMHQSVIYPVRPTRRPTRTYTPSATFTPSKTFTPFPTVTPLPTVTAVPTKPGSPIPTPSPSNTPQSPLQGA